MGHLRHLIAAIALIAAIILPQAVAAQANGANGNSERAYLVILEDGTDANWVDQVISYVFGQVMQKYDSAFTGATVMLTPDEAGALEARPEVRSVFEEITFSVDAQAVPTGIRRIDTPNIDGGGANNPIHVAVLDTGIDLDHPDLNIGNGINCINSSLPPDDDHGHGTHVAGTIAALDNSIGVVGVAPGAVVHPVKVLNSAGNSQGGSIGCGLDWVLDNANLIDVVNMSLGGTNRSLPDEDNCGYGNGDGFHQFVCAIVSNGIPVVVAAGNEGQPTTYKMPARYREAITVSALADSDGLAGGLGPNTSRGPDDTLANFSNYGTHIDVIAPGVSIHSTYPGGYASMSGTSMATPHVAGAAALYLAQNGSATPAQVDAALKSTGNTNWTGDRDSWKEPLINASALVGGSGPPQAVDAEVVSASASPSTIAQNGGNVTITASVRNNGTSTVSIPVSVSGPNGFSATATASSVASGQAKNVQFSWPASIVGTHTFQVTANLSGDGNAANNSKATNAVTVSAPAGGSLYVSGITLTTSEYQARGTTAYNVTATVSVATTAGSGAGATVSGSFTFPDGSTRNMTATANGSGVATLVTRSTASGIYTLLVTNITKSGMSYNASLDVNNPASHDTDGGSTPPPPPPPATVDAQVVSASATPATITQNSGNVTITASVRNNGDAAAAIPVSISGPNGYTSNTTTGTLASGQSQNVQFTWPASIVGTHNFQVTANLSGDGNASNNSRTTNSVTVNTPPSDGDDVYVENIDALNRGGRALYFTVYVKADGGASTTGAVVEMQISGPNGTSTETGAVSSRGYAQVVLSSPPSGTYTMTVTDITLPGFTYNPARDADNPTTVNF